MIAWMGNFKNRIFLIIKQVMAFSKDPKTQWLNLSKPDDEWQVIKEMALWTIPSAIARFLGWGYWHFWTSIVKSILWYLLWLVFMWGLGKLIKIFALVFNTDIDESRSMQLSFYGFLPLLIGGILYINPLLGALTPFIALYGIWIISYGLFTILDIPKTQKITIICVIVIVMILGTSIIGALTGGLLPQK